MSQAPLYWAPGALRAKVSERIAYAVSVGALQSWPSTHELIEQNGVRFIVRSLTALALKDRAGHSGKARDPFLPYEPALFVTDLSATHLCLLNKYNVLDRHLLIVTRAFDDQERALTAEDFAALWPFLNEWEGLAFYNAGKTAGASQRHKHLQFVTLPLVAEVPALPIEPMLETTRFQNGIGSVPLFTFAHRLTQLDPDWLTTPDQAARIALERYRTLLAALRLDAPRDAAGRLDAYNLLITRRWMLLVARAEERFLGISINALGFAGALLVRNAEQLKVLKQQGPLTALSSVAVDSVGSS